MSNRIFYTRGPYDDGFPNPFRMHIIITYYIIIIYCGRYRWPLGGPIAGRLHLFFCARNDAYNVCIRTQA